MPACFELSKSKDGQFHFVLKDDKGETILSSELYKTHASAANGIASVQKNCDRDEAYETRTSSNGKPYFVLKALNHQIIGQSQMFPSEAACANDILSVKTHGSTTLVKDLTA